MRSDIEGVPIETQVDGIETRGAAWGDVLVRHIDLPAGVDFTPLLKGLPHDRGQCPHWGYVLEGAITVQYADGTEETTRAGGLYYWPAGHTRWAEGGATFPAFRPTEPLPPRLEHP